MYSYKVKWLNEDDQPEMDLGIVGGGSWAQAAAEVAQYFGPENIIDMQLITLENSTDSLLSLTDVKHLADLFQN